MPDKKPDLMQELKGMHIFLPLEIRKTERAAR